ncbi:hypothetical protein [Romboutsia lituseburensis]|uniref:hypothetical protein n=1 Tax=Romboutsia lituseburensis TaxID=1537 RepID=UPI00215B6032|nr:hypothetical protein [Romboutsia lituseburensis]MCR8745232.1 hypothetical protein [Romboutsia lituseburensis]
MSKEVYKQTDKQIEIQEQREQRKETLSTMADVYRTSKTIENKINSDIKINEDLKGSMSYLLSKGYEAVTKEVIRPQNN